MLGKRAQSVENWAVTSVVWCSYILKIIKVASNFYSSALISINEKNRKSNKFLTSLKTFQSG